MIIVNNPTCTIEFAGPTTIDLADYLVAIDIDRQSEAIDGRTFGKPRRSRMGGGMDAITLALLWSDAMYVDLSAHEYEEGELVVTPVAGGDTYTLTVKYGKVPTGTWRPDTKIEVDLVMGVLSTIAVS